MKTSLPQLSDIMIHNRTKPANKSAVKTPKKPLETRPHTSSADSAENTRFSNSNSAQTDPDSDKSKENFEKVLEKKINSKAEKKNKNQPSDTENTDSEDAEKAISTGIPIAEITPANQEKNTEAVKVQATNPDKVKESGDITQKTQVTTQNAQKSQTDGKKSNTSGVLDPSTEKSTSKLAEQNTAEKSAVKPVNDVQISESEFKGPKNSKKTAEITEKSPEINKKQVPKNKAGLNQQGKPKVDSPPEEAIKTGTKADAKSPKAAAAAPEQLDTKKDIESKQTLKPEIKTENKSEIKPEIKSETKTPNTAANSNKPISDDNVKTANINMQSKPETEAGKENLRNIDTANPAKSAKIDVDDMPKPVQQNISQGTTEVQTAEGKINIKPGSATSTVNQVIRGIESSSLRGREQISMAIDPPELGKVQIRFQQRNGELVGVISADKVRTQQDISDETPALMRSLQNSGVAVKKVEVVLTEEGRQDMLKQENRSTDLNDNQNQDTGKGSAQSDSQGQRRQTNAKNFTSAYKPANPENQHQQSTNEDAINVYM